MFFVALAIGIYSYLVFFLGIAGFLYKTILMLLTVVFWGGIVLWKRSEMIKALNNIKEIKKIRGVEKVIVLMSCLLVLQASINLIGVFGPEISFDALWYHLTLPKLYLQEHRVFYIPGGLLYYSAMPKLTEMLYITALALQNETLAKLLHFGFGVLSSVALYKLARLFLSQKFSALAVVIFSANLVVGWESIAAYIDLARTYFEVLALWAFVLWWRKEKQQWLLLSAAMIGLAITVKYLAVGSLFIFLGLILIRSIKKNERRRGVRDIVYYILTALLVPMPWLIFSYLNTGNLFYPFFTPLYPIEASPLHPILFIQDLWVLFTRASDPLSFVYIVLSPLVVVVLVQNYIIKQKSHLFSFLMIYSKSPIFVIGIYSVLALVLWYFTPRTGGGRFILPYLPAFSLIVAMTVWKISTHAKMTILYQFCLLFIIGVSLYSILYRGGANAKFVPVILGYETKAQFLAKHLNFSFGDFYDIDGYFDRHIKKTDKVVTMGFHNLYYVNFPFVDVSWIQKGEKFNYIATQQTTPPKQYEKFPIVYENKTTHVTLYKTGWQVWE